MNDFAIEMSGVSKRYRFFSLEDIRLNVPEGQIMGLIGPNGRSPPSGTSASPRRTCGSMEG